MNPQLPSKVVNCTAHDVVVQLASNDDETTHTMEIVIPSSGHIARCSMISEEIAWAEGHIPIVKSELGGITGLPDPIDGVLYLCSTLVAQKAARMGRTDVITPDTGPTAIREDGQVKAVIRFQCF